MESVQEKGRLLDSRLYFKLWRRTVWVLVCLLSFTCVAQGQPAAMRIDVDATQVARRLIHSHIAVPVSGTEVTLSYPLWSPGDHAPFQHVGQIGSLFFHTGDKELTWTRDLGDANAFHVSFPEGTSSVDVDFDFLLPAPGEALADSSEHLLILRWNLLMLYTAGRPVNSIPIVATVKFPSGWQFSTALPVQQENANQVLFKPASLETLVDSPVLAGLYMRKIMLPYGRTLTHEMDVAAESDADLPSDQDVAASFGKLVEQTHLLFGTQHYQSYKFLVAASPYTSPGGGIEHHESSDDRVPGDFFHQTRYQLSMGELLAHEYAHSWNGKYRRPADLYAIDYQQPEKTDLLWIYESLTDYLGVVLAARSGFQAEDDVREHWAALAAKVDHETGRTWRNMQDTANSVPITMQELFLAPPGWDSWLRMLDYYDEGALLWLEVDQIIVAQTHGVRSLDYFLKLFFAGDDGLPLVKTYVAQDVIDALNQTAAYDWKGFFQARLTSHSPHAPMNGLEKAGWRLVYTAQPNTFLAAARPNGLGATMNSIGLAIGSNGILSDVLRGGPSDSVGLVPGMRIVTVNGQPWSPAVLLSAIAKTATPTNTVHLQLEMAGVSHQVDVPYQGGPQFPHLERIHGVPDRLSELLHPLRVSR